MDPSLRTRIRQRKAAWDLGMQVMVMNAGQDSGVKLEFEDGVIMDGGSVEHVKDAAAVLAQYCDIIGLRPPTLSDREKDDNETVTAFCAMPPSHWSVWNRLP